MRGGTRICTSKHYYKLYCQNKKEDCDSVCVVHSNLLMHITCTIVEIAWCQLKKFRRLILKSISKFISLWCISRWLHCQFLHKWPTVSIEVEFMLDIWCMMTLTHWGRHQIDAISQTTFSNAFPRIKMNEIRLGFHWSLFLKFELTIFQHWFR